MSKTSTVIRDNEDPPPSWAVFLMQQRRSQSWNAAIQRRSIIRMTTTWLDLERYLRTVSLSDREIASFRHLYHDLNVRRVDVICSLAYFRLAKNRRHPAQQQRRDALENLAQFLTDPNVSQHVKIFSLRLIPVLTDRQCQAIHKEDSVGGIISTTTTTQYQQVLSYCCNRSSCITKNNGDDRYTDLVHDLRTACQYEMHLPQQESLLRAAVVVDPLSVSLSNDVVWEVIRIYLLSNRVPTQELPALEVAYRRGVRHEVILASVSFVRLECQSQTTKQRKRDDYPCQAHTHGGSNDHDDNVRHGRAIANIATYLADPVLLDSAKIACLQCLWNTKLNHDERSEDDCKFWMSALVFCIDSSANIDAFLVENNPRMAMLWEIRAVALHAVEEHRKRQEELLAPALLAASIITETAEWVKTGLQLSSTVVNHGLERSSRFIVEHTEPSTCKWWDSSVRGDNDNDVSYHLHRIPELTSAAKRATSQTRLSSARTIRTFRDASARCVLEQISSPEQQQRQAPPQHHSQHGSWFLPRKVEHRALVLGVSELTLATLGAAAMIGEAVAVSTGSMVHSAAHATAHVIGHKYGTTAGQVVRDISDTAGNVLRTTGNLKVFMNTTSHHRGGGGTSSVAKSIAKNAGKQHIQQQKQEKQWKMQNAYPTNETESTLPRRADDCVDRGLLFSRFKYLSDFQWKSPKYHDDDDDEYSYENDSDSETETTNEERDPTIVTSQQTHAPIIIRI